MTMVNQQEIVAARNYYVAQSNTLLYAGGAWTTEALKLKTYIFSLVKESDSEFVPFNFSPREYWRIVCGLYGKSGGGGNYKCLRYAILILVREGVIIIDPMNTCPAGADGNLRRFGGSIPMVLCPGQKPYLLGLTSAGNYTQYTALNVYAMSHKHSIRLYEVLYSKYSTYLNSFKRNSKHGEAVEAKERSIQIGELKRLLGLEGKYRQYHDFRRWVLEPAIKEINKYTQIDVLSCDVQRKGRKVAAIKFEVKAKEGNEPLRASANADYALDGKDGHYYQMFNSLYGRDGLHGRGEDDCCGGNGGIQFVAMAGQMAGQMASALTPVSASGECGSACQPIGFGFSDSGLIDRLDRLAEVDGSFFKKAHTHGTNAKSKPPNG
jgi:hypothetical protein